MFANQAKLFPLAGFAFTCLVLVWAWTSWRRGQYKCGDSDAESVLVRNYRRHLEEMQTAIGHIRKQKGAGNSNEIAALQSQLGELQKQLMTVQALKAEEEQRNKQTQAALQQAAAQAQAPLMSREQALPRMTPTLDRMPLPSDAKDWSKQPKRAPTFVELYEQLYFKKWDEVDNVIMGFPNPYNKVAHMNYPHSSVWLEGDKIMTKLLEELKPQEPTFIVEAGSMHGGSAIRMSMELDKKGYKEVPILCIDPWTGDLNMWLNRIVWEHLDVRHGRATTFDQFVLNVRKMITDGKISAHHINPFPVTSIVGARWLQATGFTPNIIYLDSAHEIDETYYELCLYWHLLQPGGILMGDDYGWLAVRLDVDRFVKDKNLKLNMFGVYYNWYIKKPADWKPEPSVKHPYR